MRFKPLHGAAWAPLVFLFLAMPSGGLCLAPVPISGAVGTVAAVERIDEAICRGEASGRCAFDAVRNAVLRLRACMAHFGCVGASGVPDIRIHERFEPMTEHDPGPAIVVEAGSMRCARDPRAELGLVPFSELRESCSRLEWKCDVVWIPDEDKTTAFIGALHPPPDR